MLLGSTISMFIQKRNRRSMKRISSQFLRFISLLLLFSTSITLRSENLSQIDIDLLNNNAKTTYIEVPEEIQYAIVSLANELKDDQMDSALAHAAQLLVEGHTVLPKELVNEALTESI